MLLVVFHPVSRTSSIRSCQIVDLHWALHVSICLRATCFPLLLSSMAKASSVLGYEEMCMFMVCEPLPCNPAAETALHPMIRCSILPRVFFSRWVFFSETPAAGRLPLQSCSPCVTCYSCPVCYETPYPSKMQNGTQVHCPWVLSLCETLCPGKPSDSPRTNPLPGHPSFQMVWLLRVPVAPSPEDPWNILKNDPSWLQSFLCDLLLNRFLEKRLPENVVKVRIFMPPPTSTRN